MGRRPENWAGHGLEDDSMRVAARGFLRAALVPLVAIAAATPGTAMAAPPAVTISSPLDGGVGSNVTQATQTNLASETGLSSPVTFVVKLGAPTVTLNSPPSPSTNTTPSFTGTASDVTPVTVQIHVGATVKDSIVSRATAAGTGAGWTSDNASPALSSGQYTAVAVQASSLPGHPAGRSKPVTFTITSPIKPPPVAPGQPPVSAPPVGEPPVGEPPVGAPPVGPPPAASFRWFPAVPQTGEPVSLVSTSNDASSPIVSLAWALGGPFQPGGTVVTTSFSTPGGHLVRLLVTNAYGLSSVASETITVVGPRVPLMQPFPVVRIAGAETGSGVKLRLLRVQQTPAGARVTVRCRGRRCPVKSASHVAVSRRLAAPSVEFRSFERSLRFGVTLEILVSKPGEIGKYTRFEIRRRRLPVRVDMCLDPAGLKPLVCPSS
jgi:PKD domain